MRGVRSGRHIAFWLSCRDLFLRSCVAAHLVVACTGGLLLRRPTDALVDPSRSPVEIGSLEVKRVAIESVIPSRGLVLIRGTDSLPRLRLLLHEVSRIDLGEASTELAIRDHVEATTDFLGHAHARYFLQRHFIKSLLLSEGIVSDVDVDLVLGFESLLLVGFALVSLL